MQILPVSYFASKFHGEHNSFNDWQELLINIWTFFNTKKSNLQLAKTTVIYLRITNRAIFFSKHPKWTLSTWLDRHHLKFFVSKHCYSTLKIQNNNHENSKLVCCRNTNNILFGRALNCLKGQKENHSEIFRPYYAQFDLGEEVGENKLTTILQSRKFLPATCNTS